MEKMFIYHRLTDENQRPAMERWMRRYHVPEVMVQYPWMLRYLLYRPAPPPPGAGDFATYDYRIHENWAPSFKERRGTRGLLPMTPGPPGVQAQIVHVPAEPTEDFLGAGLSYEGHSILRWVVAIRYPEGVPRAEAEDWYLNTHVPETMKQPGLIRLFSHKCVEFEGSPLPISVKGGDPGQAASMMRHWDRLTELWYENNAGWADSVLINPPAYTRPCWASRDSYPFLKQEEDFVSTFILESPDCDFTREYRQLYF